MSDKKALTIIIKTVERCNINCSYCYFFNSADDSFKFHPPYIKKNTIQDIVAFLEKAVTDMGLTMITIGFNGGEPLMQKKIEFDYAATYIREKLSPLIENLVFTIQTNGMLVDEAWMELFVKHQFYVGVSIDGPREYHDQHRVDHFNRGTYDRVKERIMFVKQHKNLHKLGGGGIGALSVVNIEMSAKLAYEHLVHELGFKKLDFLLPDWNYKSKPSFKEGALKYGQFMIEIFDIWTKNDDPDVEVRFCKSALTNFMGGNTLTYGIGKQNSDVLPIISISSNGDISTTDELKDTSPKMFSGYNGANVKTISYQELLQTPQIAEIQKATTKTPDGCIECRWKNVCAGGGIAHRYSVEKGFNNPSIYCEGLKNFYSHVANFMIKNGYDQNKLDEVLNA
jgi:uncharacterized protein